MHPRAIVTPAGTAVPLRSGGWAVDTGGPFPVRVSDRAAAAACLGVPPRSSAGVGTVRPAPADPNVPAAVDVPSPTGRVIPQSAAAGARGKAGAPIHTPGSGVPVFPADHPPVRAGEADGRLAAAPPFAAGEASTGASAPAWAADSFHTR